MKEDESKKNMYIEENREDETHIVGNTTWSWSVAFDLLKIHEFDFVWNHCLIVESRSFQQLDIFFLIVDFRLPVL